MSEKDIQELLTKSLVIVQTSWKEAGLISTIDMDAESTTPVAYATLAAKVFDILRQGREQATLD